MNDRMLACMTSGKLAGQLSFMMAGIDIHREYSSAAAEGRGL
jgi:hypothetical protein